MQTKINVETLHSLICEQGLLKAIRQTFGSSVKIRIFFPDNVCKLSIDELDLSVRGNNCLKRDGIHFIGDLIDRIENSSLKSIRNLGGKTMSEIKTKLLEFVYKSLPKNRQFEFLSAIIEDNAK